MFKKNKIIVLAWFSIFYFAQALHAQKLLLSAPFDSNPALTNFFILGSQENQFYVLSNSVSAAPSLLIYNNSLELLSETKLPWLQNSFLLSFIPRKDGIDFLFENADSVTRYYKQVKLNNNGEMMMPVKEILALPLQYAKDWYFAASPSRKSFLLYQLSQPEKDSIKMDMIIIGNDFEVVDGKRFNFFVESDFERLGNFFIDDDGNIYVLVHDRPLNYKLGSRLRLFKYFAAGGSLVKKEFYLKEKKPIDVHLSFSPENKSVYLHSFYADFYTKDINGIFTAALNEKLEPRVSFTFFAFDKKFKKELNTFSSGISSDNLMNYLRITNSSVSDSGSSFVTALLETSSILSIPNSGIHQPAEQRTTATDQDPLMAIAQREYLIRREMGIIGPSRGRRIVGGSSSGASTGYAEAYSNIIYQRPDLFFMPKDTAGNKNVNKLPRKKIYDRQLVFGFNKNATLEWKKWFETEDQSMFKTAPLFPAEINNSIVSLYYRQNEREKTELAFTRITKPDGTLIDNPLTVPENISLLTTGPLCKLSNNRAAILYLDNKLKKVGLAVVEW